MNQIRIQETEVSLDAKPSSRNYIVDAEGYQSRYQQSTNECDKYWLQQAQSIDWMTMPTLGNQSSFALNNVSIKWFADGVLNISANCIDRHLPQRANDTAIIWEGDSPDVDKHISFAELHKQVCKLANVLKAKGVEKGDRVAIYMPMVPEAAYAMLACARIGAIHSVVFGGFSPKAIADRINDCDAKVIITSDAGRRGGKVVPIFANVAQALADNACPSITHTLVFNVVGDVPVDGKTVVDAAAAVAAASAECAPTPMSAEDPLFILYTSGSTGKPKGVLHTTGGYIVHASTTHKMVFDYQPGEVYWCAADVGWITGHTYIVYGPLANGATTVMFEGVPTYPDVRRISQIVDKHDINILYTAPTAIRALMAQGDFAAEGTTRKTLRLLGSVGEPINPEAWQWYHRVIGNSQCPIIDTWWQTETGGMMITPYPGATELKPGSATNPVFGVCPQLVDNEGTVLEGTVEGNLVITESWPGQSRTLWGDHERFVQTYFSTYEGKYFTGDGARRDEDGYYWITGRVDDVLNVSGHRLGTAEIESALVAHPTIAEAAVVGYPHDIKGQGIYVYIIPVAGTQVDDALTKDVVKCVRQELSPIATPDLLHWTSGLPKTRSGKIMRRILRKIAADDFANLGDTSTLAEPDIVNELIENRMNRA